ncbi:MAG: UbiX family flavin prenyltransferase [Phycisphaerales bacterium]|nr:UbiX family flavin prenyltransferase [Phycisphaerales bacterium]
MQIVEKSRDVVMAITGASGGLYAQRLLQSLADSQMHTHLVVSPLGRRLLADELDIQALSVEALVGRSAPNVTLYPYRDVGAKIASGSFLTRGMVVCPCSSNTLGEMASGIGSNLILRAAAVTLKESRRLVVIHREMPLSAIELENMQRLQRAGAIICPAAPGFYLLPRTIGDLVDFVVGKVLDLLWVPHGLNTRWQSAPEPGVEDREDD